MNIPCILIPALVGLICGILGYLLGKMNAKGDDSLALSLQADLDACKANTKSLNAKIASLETDLANQTKGSVQSFAGNLAPAVLFDGALAAKVLGHKIKENDLKIVEGIGPKIEELYHKAGIKTWLQLSETPTSKSQAILDAAGENYAIHNPGTWAKQALLAYQGKWEELKDWQDTLDGGKE
jgi:predicted flap endonuclease-1-like 5' DNA nuclease